MPTDPHRLRQVLKNLLSNAVKFTSQGEVSLRMDLSGSGWDPARRQLEEAESVIAIRVIDTGIGIRDDLQAAMFEAFAQADGTTAREYGGTGLGLSISRDLVGLLGGEIKLDSELGTGSTFTVYLPLGAAPSPTTNGHATNGHVPEAEIRTPMSPVPPPATPAEPLAVAVERSPVDPAPPPKAEVRSEGDEPFEQPGAGSRGPDDFYRGFAAGTVVLVVDDDFRNIFALTALLERGELDVVAAQSGAAALAVLQERDDIDLILMDIMMPVMDGYETMTAIRKLPAFSDLPIIAVTGKVVGSERERCIEAGASDYIPKPVNTVELLESLSKWFPVGAARAEGAGRPSGAPVVTAG
jgi:hypothetical protein